jgi:arylsulfatase A-like enzyme
MATRAPLLVAVPGGKAAGHSTRALVEFVDLYATLAELAGLPAPARHEGSSFAALLKDPMRPWKRAAFSEMNRGGRLGRAIRTESHRYVEWTDRTNAAVGRELYDYMADPDETENLADKPEHAARVQELARQLAAGWKAAGPPRLP